MPVLADSQEAQLRLKLLKEFRVLPASLFGIRFAAVDAVELSHPLLARQALPQVTPERREMPIGDSKIFVQVKTDDLVPWQTGRRGQSIQRRDLRSASGKDQDDDLSAYRQFPKMVGYPMPRPVPWSRRFRRLRPQDFQPRESGGKPA
jgi:hypothetical protein